MPGECRTCRWWNTAYKYVGRNDTMTCDAIHATGSTSNRAAKIYPVGNGWLSTRPDFGCSLHEPRRETSDAD